MIQRVVDLLRAHRLAFVSEAELQEAIARLLAEASIPFKREVVLSREDRIDFMVDGGLGIEVKIGGSGAALARQAYRYAEHAEISSLLLVTSRMQHGAIIPAEMSGKPVRVLTLMRGL